MPDESRQRRRPGANCLCRLSSDRRRRRARQDVRAREEHAAARGQARAVGGQAGPPAGVGGGATVSVCLLRASLGDVSAAYRARRVWHIRPRCTRASSLPGAFEAQDGIKRRRGCAALSPRHAASCAPCGHDACRALT